MKKQKDLISKLATDPLMRAIRPGKLTVHALQMAIMNYLKEEDLFERNYIFESLSSKEDYLKDKADSFSKLLDKLEVKNSSKLSLVKIANLLLT